MKFNKKVLTAIVMASISMPIFAADLTIKNRTNYYSTVKVNGGACSDFIGAQGITPPRTDNPVPENLLIKICKLKKPGQQYCMADVYMTNNCKGEVIASVSFDPKTGIQSITKINNKNADGVKFSVAGTGFTAIITEDSATTSWMRMIFSK